MKERPILMSGPMAAATFNGTKTQTRRIIKQDLSKHSSVCHSPAIKFFSGAWGCPCCGYFHWDDSLKCRYGQPGDRLWVRESYGLFNWSKDYESGHIDDVYGFDGPLDEAKKAQGFAHPNPAIAYRASGYWEESATERGFRWRPSIHMPRWASRSTLELEAVRVERLNDISEDDALSEGVRRYGEEPKAKYGVEYPLMLTAKNAFAWLWESINGRGSWDKNPWVWVISFKRV